LVTLPLPPHFDPARAGEWGYRPDVAKLSAAALAWRHAHGIRPAGQDRHKRHLLVIDAQRDFCHPEGTLFVAGRSGRGAIDDSARLAHFLYENLDTITDVTATFDSHLAHQIFFAPFWVDETGAPLAAYREVTADDVASGRARPAPHLADWLAGGDEAWLLAQVLHYCRELERVGKYKLYLWPPHCLVGGDGHALVGVLQEARLFHAFVRSNQAWNELKGDHPLTENYSVLSPEVLTRHDGGELARPNLALVDRLAAADEILVAGQASSHCVRSTVDDLVTALAARDPALVKRVVVLRDCTSAVTVPDGKGGFLVDFTAQAEAAFAKWASLGVRLASAARP
jgi:nicotinamidase-related amidase